MSMLEYYKIILEKVSFDENLFRIELLKATKKLIANEIQELKRWCIETFGISYCTHAVPEFIN